MLALISVCILVAGFVLLELRPGRESSGPDADSLTVYCAAGLRPAMERVRTRYEEEYEVRVNVNYGGSGSLLSTLRGAAEGDLYVAADVAYVDRARELGLVDEAFPFAFQRPVVAVAKGNPKRVRGFSDLLRQDVRVGAANPEAAAVGKCLRNELNRVGKWEALEERLVTMKPTVNEVTNDVKLGAVDAGITWDATLVAYPELEAVDLPELSGARRQLAAAVLRSTATPTSALRFARYLTARDRGLEEFKASGFEVVNGDIWAEVPRLILFSGAMLRPGIAESIAAFERREGCEVATQYNGCGILVSLMKAGTWPDAYVSCDRLFMDAVEDGFQQPRDLTENDMVILVAKGNPRQVRGLADLGREELKIGLADPDKSALGELARRMIVRAGLWSAVDAGVDVYSPTGDILVNQVLTGSLDAAVVYRSNVLAHEGNRDRLEAVEVGVDDAVAFQSYAIGRETDHPRLLGRLFERVRGATARARFESVGFRWIGE